jgi:hypothetical protein
MLAQALRVLQRRCVYLLRLRSGLGGDELLEVADGVVGFAFDVDYCAEAVVNIFYISILGG